MIQGVYKFRTDIRIFDMQINRICRLILFVKYLFTFRMQEAKAALDLDKELSSEEEVKLRNMISKYLSRTQYDVGVDNNNYIPVSYAQVKCIINKQVNEAQKS